MIELCSRCFKHQCKHKAEKFPCDELMVYPIQALNGLGYKTLYCCSGHMSWDNCIIDIPDPKDKDKRIVKEVPVPEEELKWLQTYIMFDRLYNFPDYPMTFNLGVNLHNKAFYLETQEIALQNNMKSRHNHILTSMKYLTDWVDKLPPWDGSEYKPTKAK